MVEGLNDIGASGSLAPSLLVVVMEEHPSPNNLTSQDG